MPGIKGVFDRTSEFYGSGKSIAGLFNAAGATPDQQAKGQELFTLLTADSIDTAACLDLIAAGAVVHLSRRTDEQVVTTTLMLAAARGEEKIVKAILDKKENPNYFVNDTDLTALMFATKNNHIGCMKLLLDAGADAEMETMSPGHDNIQLSGGTLKISGKINGSIQIGPNGITIDGKEVTPGGQKIRAIDLATTDEAKEVFVTYKDETMKRQADAAVTAGTTEKIVVEPMPTIKKTQFNPGKKTR